MLYNVLLIVLIVVSVAMIVLILMQQGKGADAGAAFGSGASGTVFGSRGSANFLSRATAILATIFFLTALALAFLASGRVIKPGSIMDTVTPAVSPVKTEAAASVVPSSDVPPAPAVDKEAGDVPSMPAVKADEKTATADKPSESSVKREEKSATSVDPEKKPERDEKAVQEKK